MKKILVGLRNEDVAPLRISPFLAVMLASWLYPQGTQADNTWIGNGSTANWSDGGNWTLGAITNSYFGTLTFDSGGTTGTSSANNVAGVNGNMLLWTGTSSWTLGGSVISLYDNGGTQAKLENQSTGLVTINAPITFAATSGAAFGEINAVNGDVTFGTGALTVNGSGVNGLKFWGGTGRNVTFNNAVSATGKWLATTGAGAITIGSSGSVTAADIFVMNGGVLNLAGTLTSDATKGIRLGGDFAATGNQDQTKSGTLNITPTAGGVTYAGVINSVAGNTSGALAVNSLNTGGTNTLSGGIFLDSALTISQTGGGTLALTTGGIDLKGNMLTINAGSVANVNASGIISNSTGAGNLVKTGNGTLTLSGANTFTGKTTINGGILAINADGKLGTAPGAPVVDQLTLNGGTLMITAAGQTLNVNRGITLGASGATIDTSTISGSAITTTVGGAITGSGPLTLKSTGNLSSNGGGDGGLGIYLTNTASDFVGDVAISSGLVTYAGNGAFGNAANKIILNGGGLLDNNTNIALARDIQVLAGGGTFRTYGTTNVNWSGAISGSGNVNRTDGGTLNLTGNVSGYTGTFNNQNGSTLFQTGSNPLTGTLTVNAGTVSVENSATNTYSAVNLNGGTLRVKSNNNALGAVTLAVGGSATLATQSGSSAVTLANNIMVAGTNTLTLDGGFSALRINGNITGSGIVVQSNAPGVTLGGTVDVGTGIIQALGNNTLTFASGATITAAEIKTYTGTTAAAGLQFDGASVSTKYLNIGNDTNGRGTVNQTAGTVTVVSGGNGFRLGHWNQAANPASLYNLTGGTLDATGLSVNAGAAQLVNIGWDGQGNMAVGGGAGTATLKAYGIQLDANGDSGTYNDTLTLSANGIVEVGIGGIGAASVNDYVILNGGTLKATGSATWGTVFNSNASTTSSLDVNGATITLNNSVTGTATVNLPSATGALILTTAGTQTFSAGLNGTTAISKTGTGTTTLSGGGTYNGTITVNDGRLNLAGTTAAAISVVAAKTLGGEGTTTGGLTLNGANLNIDGSTVGKLTVGNFTLTGTNTVRFDVMPAVASGPVNVLAYTGTLSGVLGTNFMLANASNFRTSTFVNSGGVITLDIGSKNLTWNGTSGSQWDVRTSARWNAGEADLFSWGDTVTFDDIGVTTAVSTIGLLEPTAVTVTGTKNYTISGSAGNLIQGATGLTKSGTSTLVVTGPNTYTGLTNVTNGTLQVGDGTSGTASIGTGAATVGTGATMRFFSNGGTTNVTNAISGAGILVFAGTGVSATGHYDLLGNNSGFTGAININYGARVLVDSANDVGIASMITVANGGQVYGFSSRPLTISGNGWQEAAGQLGAIRLTGTQSANITLAGNSRITSYGGNGAISGVISGAYAVEFGPNSAASQIITLSVQNTYTAGTTVNTAILELTGGGGSGGTIRGTVDVNSGSTLRLSTGDATGYAGDATSLRVINLNGGTLNVNTTANQTLGSAVINLTGGTVSGIAGSNIDFFQGASGLNSLASATTSIISVPTISIRQTAGITMNVADGLAATDLQIDSIIGNKTEGATAPITKLGAGTLVLNGANTMVGAANVYGGTLSVSGASGSLSASTGVNIVRGATFVLNNTSAANNTNRLKDAGTVTMNGGTLNFSNNAGAVNYSETTGALTLASGGNTISASQAATSQTSTFTFASLTRTGGAVNFQGTGLGVDARNKILFTANPTLANSIIGSWAAYNGTDWATYDATLGVKAYASYVDVTRLTASKVIADATGSNVRIIEGSGAAADITLGAAKTNINTLLQSVSGGTSAGAVDLSTNTLRLGTAGGILVASGSGPLTLNNGTLTGGGNTDGTAGTIELNNQNAVGGNALIINSTVANNVAGVINVVKDGPGLVTLTGSNSYTGVTTINDGVLAVSNFANGGVNGGIGASPAAAANLVLNGGTLRYTGNTISSDHGFTVGANLIGTVDVSTSGQTLTLSGGIANTAGNFVKAGAGNLTLSGASSHTGTTTVTGGTLRLAASIANNAGWTVGSGARMEFAATNLIVGGHGTAVADSKLITVDGGTFVMDASFEARIGNVTLSNGGTWTSNRALASYDWLLANVSSGAAATVTVANTLGTAASSMTPGAAGNGIHLQGVQNFSVADVTTTTATDLTVSMVLADPGTSGGNAGGINKTGTGTMALTGANTYTGATNVNGGLLAIGTGGAIAAGSTITVNSGATLRFDRGDIWGGHTAATSSPLVINQGGTLATNGFFNTIISPTFNGGTVTLNGGFSASYPALALKGIVTVGGSAPSAINVGTGSNNAINIGPSGTAGTLTFNVADVTSNNQTDLTVNPALQNNWDAAGIANVANSLTKTGAGTMALMGLNTYTGGTIVNAGTLVLGRTANDGTGNIRGTLDINSGATVRLDGVNVLGYNGTQVSTITINGGTLETIAAGDNGWGQAFNLTGGIMRSNGGVSSATATQLFAIGNGTTFVTNASADASQVTGRLTLRQSNTTFTVADGAAATDLLVSAIMTENSTNSGITKLGAGTMQVTGANTYAGVTTINAGTLSIASISNGGIASPLGASTNAASNLVLGGGTLQYTGVTASTNRSLTLTNATTSKIEVSSATAILTVSGVTAASTGALTKDGVGTLTLTGANLHTGVTTISAGKLALSGVGSLSDSARVDLASGSIFDIQGITSPSESIGSLSGAATSSVVLGAKTLEIGLDNTDSTFSGTASGSGGSFTKSGPGTTTLAGSNTYSGSTNITNGTLLLGANNTLPDTAALNLSSGAKLGTGGYSDTTGALSVANTVNLDMGSSAGALLTFASIGTWTGLLNVWNYTGAPWTSGTDKLIFSTGGVALDDLHVNFYSGSVGDTGSLIGTGGGGLISMGGSINELVPVPEPSAALGVAGLIGLIGFRERRRLLYLRK